MTTPLLTLVLVACIALPVCGAEALLLGTGESDVTPPLGYRMSGYFHERLNEGTVNPLLAKAMVLKQGDTEAALVFCDIIGLTLDVSSRARKAASAKTGIPAANILVAATHSHTGPLYAGALRRHFHDLAVARNGKDPQEAVDYPARLVDGIVQAIVQADKAVGPVTLAAGSARQEGLAFNRRFHMKDGTVRFNPGVLNPNIVRVAGPIDPHVGIVVARSPKGSPRTVLSSFALHLDTMGGTKYAADYPYFLQETLRQECGGDVTSLFGTGTCGDINHIDVTRKERLKTDTIGHTLGQTVAATLPSLVEAAPASLAVRSRIVDVPLQTCSDEDIAWAKASITKVGTRELPFLEQVKAYKILALQLRGGTTIPLETQVFRLAPQIAVVGLPGEVFVELGLAIKKASPFRTTLVIELCNDSPGYIPTKKAFAEGSYETVNSRIAPGGGEKLAEASIALLRELAP